MKQSGPKNASNPAEGSGIAARLTCRRRDPVRAALLDLVRDVQKFVLARFDDSPQRLSPAYDSVRRN